MAMDIATNKQFGRSECYPLPSALADGQKGDKEGRPCKNFFQGKTLFSDGTELVFKKAVISENKAHTPCFNLINRV
jgi:hypothetical protein